MRGARSPKKNVFQPFGPQFRLTIKGRRAPRAPSLDLPLLTVVPGGGYSHTLPIQVCAAQRGRDFEAPDLERGIHFRGVF